MANDLEKDIVSQEQEEDNETKKPVIRFVTDEESEKIVTASDDEPEADEDTALANTEENAETALHVVGTENGVDRLNRGLSSFFRKGTPTRTFFGAACGAGAAALCLTIGFWPTVLLSCFVGTGAVIGGAKEGGFVDRAKKLFLK